MERIEISSSIVVVFVFCFLEIGDDAVGNWKKDYLDEEFKNIVG